MSFVHPGIMAAALALALAPVVIHLINRRRYRREPWAAMDFLLAAHQTSRRRMHLEQWFLMAMRCLLVLLLGLTIARPYVTGASLASRLGQPRCDRVIMIDDSLSMQAHRDDGRSAFDEAKARALAFVDSSAAGDGLAVLTASSTGRTWMTQPVHEPQAVRSIIESLTCSAGMNDFEGGLRSAQQILSHGSASTGCRAVYVFTDLTAASFKHASGQINLDGIDRIFMVDCGPKNRDNLALERFRCAGMLVGVNTPARFALDIVNHGGATVASIPVEVQLDGAMVRRLAIGPCPAGGRVSHEFELAIPRPGSHRLTARIVSNKDVLPVDDSRFLVVQVAQAVPVLLVEGRPASAPAARELFYFSTAVCPEETDVHAPLVKSKTIAAAELEDQALADYGAVILGNVSRLSGSTWSRLEAFVRNGGGLGIFLGDQVQPDNYNNLVVTKSGSAGIVPAKLSQHFGLSPDMEPLHLQIADATHPALVDVAHSEKGGLRLANVSGFWKLEDIAPRARTLIRLSNGEGAVVSQWVGRGRVVVFTFGPNMAETSLPAKPDYLPLMLNLTAFLATPGNDAQNLLVGDSLIAEAPTLGQTELHTPSQQLIRLEPQRSADRRPEVIYRDTALQGFYSLNSGTWRYDVSVNADVNDSDLKRADSALIKSALGPRTEILADRPRASASASFAPSRELASLLGFALLAVIAMETAAATWFGVRR